MMNSNAHKAKLCVSRPRIAMVLTSVTAIIASMVLTNSVSLASDAPSKRELLDYLPKMTRMPALPTSHPFMIRASKAADDLLAALKADDVPDKYTWAWRAWVWAFYESSLTADALGDAGLSCGYLQVSNPEKVVAGATCSKVRKDGVLGFRVGIGLMKTLIDRCGSIQPALTMYATGKDCPNWTIPLVVKRMKLSGDR